MHQNYDLEDRLLQYSARIIRLVEKLPNTRAANHVAGQLLRSGTSPLPNHGEAQAAESANDFVHKLKVCLKELRESYRWLRLVQTVPLLPPKRVTPLVNETDELIRIFVTKHQDRRAEEKSPLNPCAFGLRCWKLDVECWKSYSAGGSRSWFCKGTPSRFD